VRVVIQRVARARVVVDGREMSSIGRGILALVGIHRTDAPRLAERLAERTVGARIFDDEEGRMNLALTDIGGEVLAVSQFTLYGDLRRGRRPSFTDAAPPELARPLYEAYCEAIERRGVRCGRGVFGAAMQVELVNDGPVTLILDSEELARPRRS